MKASAVVALVAACGVAIGAACGHAAPPPPPRVVPVDAAPPAAPTLRLPTDVVPTGYDLTLELDPESDTFHGKVAIHAAVNTATDRVYLHAVDLDITSARAGDATLDAIPGDAPVGMRGFKLPHVVPAGAEVELDLAYTGSTTGDQQGLFRQAVAGRWYLYAQAESVFARRIAPCFDEPRFKAPWTVTLVVPTGDAALANGPQQSERKLADGRREVHFAPTAPIASYLLSVAVGPFEVVELGPIGRANIPLRVAVPAGQRDSAGLAAAWTGKLVATLETYFDQPIPMPKLDLVAVPEFFGAMENPGLVTVVAGVLLGDSGDATTSDAGRHLARILAHELAHQWLGNTVTPPWWDDLWLSEASASWLGDKIAGELGAFDDSPLRTALARARALEADAEPDAQPLHRRVDRGDDPEAGFDAIAYDKGGAVLAMIERTAGADAMRTAVRALVHDHAGGTATTADFVAAVAAVSPDAGKALGSYVDHVGTPIVDLELRCTGAPRVDAAVRRGVVAVPVCVRYAAGSGAATACALVDGHAELPLSAATGCPSWVTGNADGIGYYEVAWNSVGSGPMAPLPAQTPAERLVYGSDIAAAVVRGDIAVTAALAELRRLAAGHDPYGDLAATAIARALEPSVDDATSPRWGDYLAAQFAHRLTAAAMLEPASPALRELRDRLVELVPGEHLPAATVQRARGELDRAIARLAPARPTGGRPKALPVIDVERIELLAAIAAPSGGPRLFDALVARAKAATDDDTRFALVSALGRFGPDLVDRAVSLVLDHALAPPLGWVAVRGYLERDATRAAAWVAIAPRAGELLAMLGPGDITELVESAGGLCSTAERDAVASTLEPHVGDIPDGRHALDHALARVDRCAARRARGAGVAAALSP
jgi:alanyl aminopeptidase